jgi:hypothetical protein
MRYELFTLLNLINLIIWLEKISSVNKENIYSSLIHNQSNVEW